MSIIMIEELEPYGVKDDSDVYIVTVRIEVKGSYLPTRLWAGMLMIEPEAN